MATPGRRANPALADDPILRAEFIRLQWLGYVRYHQMIVAGVIAFVALALIVAALPKTRFMAVVLGVVTLLSLGLAVIGTGIIHRQQVTIYTEGGLFIAEHRATGDVRHGETAEEALMGLSHVIDARRAEEG